MHLVDAFIQSDLQCIQTIHFFMSKCVPWELNPQPFALLTQCSTTEPQEHIGIMDSIKYQQINKSIINWLCYTSKVHILRYTNLKNNTTFSVTEHNTKLLRWPSQSSDPEPCRRWVRWTEEAPSWICESEGSGVILDEGMVSDLSSGVLWPEPCRRWVRWTEEAPSWICESKGSGVILDEGMSLISRQVFSNLIRRYRRTFRAVTKALIKRVPLIVANVY